MNRAIGRREYFSLTPSIDIGLYMIPISILWSCNYPINDGGGKIDMYGKLIKSLLFP